MHCSLTKNVNMQTFQHFGVIDLDIDKFTVYLAM